MLLKNKKKIIITSAITIMVCIAIIAGSTMALFSGEVTMNVAVTAGSFEVVATPADRDNNGELDFDRGSTINGQETGKPFVVVNNEETSFIDNEISLAKFTPGDWISFKIDVTNNSDIAIKCQPEIEKNSNDLTQYLEVFWRQDVDGTTNAFVNENNTPNAQAIEVLPGKTITLEVKISMPENVTAAQLKNNATGTIVYNVVAWQSNAEKPATVTP